MAMDKNIVLTAYYYASEHAYTFGPFTRSEAVAFVKNDPNPTSHDEWESEYLNDPSLYGTGNEIAY